MLNRPYWQLAILSGILIGIAYPPLQSGFFVFIGFIPLIHILLNVTPRLAAKYAFLASITANLISLYWIGMNSGASFLVVFASLIGAVLYLSIFWVLFGIFVAYAEKKFSLGLLVFPFAWVAMEYLRSFGALGFPWINIALTQTAYLPLIQIADYSGTYGIALWIILINVTLYLALVSLKKMKYLLAVGVLFVTMFLYGIARINSFESPQSPTISVAVTQPNINPDEKWDPESRDVIFELMHGLLDSALVLEPDLVLWPESAVPAYLRLSSYRRQPIAEKLIRSKTPLLSGTVDRIIDADGNKQYFNSSIFIDALGDTKMYHKKHLVPFAEYIPLSGKFPMLKKLNFGQANFLQGAEYTVFEVNSIKFSNVICYESSIPSLLRKFVQSGAQFLTIEANDGWLGKSSGPYQHFELAKLRAVENRVPIVRCANTGISGVINPIGIVENEVPLGEKKIFKAEIVPSQQLTFYTKYGDVFAIICLLLTIFIMLAGWLKNSRS